MGGSTINPATVMIEENLAGYVPQPPTRVMECFAYTFTGWYIDSGLMQAFDFANSTMPASDLTLFAGWKPAEFTVNFYDGIGPDAKIEFSHQYEWNDYIVLPRVPGTNVPGFGVFRQWLWPIGDRYSAFNEESPVTGDLNLYADWQTDSLTVTYALYGGPAGALPIDNARYSLGVYALVLAPTGQLMSFAGWQVNGTGPVYYPGSTIRVDGNMLLIARYLDPN
jgi:uncharacterized repeat protein (TIGR02543 family)